MQHKLVEGIDKEDRDHERTDEGIFEEQPRQTVFVEQDHIYQGRSYFHDQVMPMDLSTAFAALSFEQDVAEDRDVQIRRDAIAAIRASGSGEDDGLLSGQAINKDVEKASQGSA